jgi:hypothetical protein
MVTPLRDLAGVNLMRYRRALGLLAFWYALMHFSTYMVLDKGLDLASILADIAKRPFITIGMACLALLVPLALTSNAFSIRRLGSRWQSLHRLVYVVVPAAAVHYAMSVPPVPPPHRAMEKAGRRKTRLTGAAVGAIVKDTAGGGRQPAPRKGHGECLHHTLLTVSTVRAKALAMRASAKTSP